jgi:preprotein translocase subunit SecD
MKNKIVNFFMLTFMMFALGCSGNKTQTITTLSITDSSYTNGLIDTTINVIKKRLVQQRISNALVTKDKNQIIIESDAIDKDWAKDYLLKKGELCFYEMYNIADVAAGIQAANTALAKKQNVILTAYVPGPLLGIFNFVSTYGDVNGVQKMPSEIGVVYKQNLPQLKTYFEQSANYLPADIKFVFKLDDKMVKDKVVYVVYALRNNNAKAFVGNNILKAASNFDYTGKPAIAIDFNAYGSNLFKRITTNNINKNIAIVLDEEVLTAPNVIAAVDGGKVEITGSFSVKEATELAKVLSTGYLPLNVMLKSIATKQTQQ